ncbi:sugar transferase [Mesorhizobium sp. RP14(2022)]|uniref:Sugar transferase n=1 Tax=Mesorhizobium liriopis TaxID=2953882 RepID=A0ABT1C2U0_9HYPH|nr:sugar transferase [Mesorhizobium liriopis]MCO6049135.1 sugar transferase [Mesorhizobium liriopis]
MTESVARLHERGLMLDSAWILPGSRPLKLYPKVKRCIDVGATLLAAPFLLCLILVLAILIRLDGGPAFFAQPRIGMNGRPFRLWKLRSMQVDAEACLRHYLETNVEARLEWERNQKLREDPRITPLGRLIRKYSLDELPQFLNVLRGEMSLVGPRPMLLDQRRHYPGTAYFALRPGLTGSWQVSDRNDCSFAERARHDNRYAAAMSFATDLRILVMTPLVVVRGTGI